LLHGFTGHLEEGPFATGALLLFELEEGRPTRRTAEVLGGDFRVIKLHPAPIDVKLQTMPATASLNLLR
jgi:hypothetical protein